SPDPSADPHQYRGLISADTPSDQTPDDELLHQFRAQLSKMSSEEIHRILQTAFGRFDARLWRFNAGGPFDLAGLQRSLELADLDPASYGASAVLTAVVTRLPPSPVREDLVARSLALATATDAPLAEEKRTALRGVSWFLDRAAEGGLPL